MENIDYAPSSFGDIKMSDLNDALAHHGIKGQRWGIRRFQNKDGSLTDAGRKRQTLGERIHARKVKKKRAEALEKARIARAEKQKVEAERQQKLKSGKIKPKDMTEAELIDAINKKTLEKRYSDLLDETSASRKAMTEGKGFVKKMWKEAVTPAMTEAGKKVLTNYLIDRGEKALGLKLKDTDEMATLKKTYEKLDLQKKIKDLKKPDSDELSELKKIHEKLDLEKKINDLKNPKTSLSDTVRDLENQRKYETLIDDEYQALKREAQKAENRKKINDPNYDWRNSTPDRDKNNNGFDDDEEEKNS